MFRRILIEVQKGFFLDEGKDWKIFFVSFRSRLFLPGNVETVSNRAKRTLKRFCEEKRKDLGILIRIRTANLEILVPFPVLA